MTTFGYLLASKTDCSKQEHGKGMRELIEKEQFHFVPWNISGAILCQPDLLLTLEPRPFEYSYIYQEDWNITDFRPEWRYAPAEWKEAQELLQLYDSTRARELNWDKLYTDYRFTVGIPVCFVASILSVIITAAVCIMQLRQRPISTQIGPPIVIENKVEACKEPPPPAAVAVFAPPLYPTAPPLPVTPPAPKTPVLHRRENDYKYVIGENTLDRGGLDF